MFIPLQHYSWICSVYSVPPPFSPIGWKLIFISPRYLVHSSVLSDFLTDLIFWLPFACFLSFRPILNASNPCYLLLHTVLPAEPPGGWEAPLTWSHQDSPSRGWRCWQSSPGRMHIHLASYPQEGQKHRRTCSPGRDDRERKVYLGKEYSLIQRNQLAWMKPDPFLTIHLLGI